MSVYHQQNSLYHIYANQPSCHFSDRTEGNIVLKQKFKSGVLMASFFIFFSEEFIYRPGKSHILHSTSDKPYHLIPAHPTIFQKTPDLLPVHIILQRCLYLIQYLEIWLVIRVITN